ncbi:hypothetical protein D3C84_606780 [compost metagenome]
MCFGTRFVLGSQHPLDGFGRAADGKVVPTVNIQVRVFLDVAVTDRELMGNILTFDQLGVTRLDAVDIVFAAPFVVTLAAVRVELQTVQAVGVGVEALHLELLSIAQIIGVAQSRFATVTIEMIEVVA